MQLAKCQQMRTLHYRLNLLTKNCNALCTTDPSLQGDPDLGLVGDKSDRGAQHLVFGTLDGVSLDPDHLPADLFERQDLDQAHEVWTMK